MPRRRSVFAVLGRQIVGGIIRRMGTDLNVIKAALADLTDAELHALIAASNTAQALAYGLLVWIEGACDWELNRRAGHDHESLPPEAAIDPGEDAMSIDAAIAMRATFAQDSRRERWCKRAGPSPCGRPSRFLDRVGLAKIQRLSKNQSTAIPSERRYHVGWSCSWSRASASLRAATQPMNIW